MSGYINGPLPPESLVGALHDREPDAPHPSRRLRVYLEPRDAWIGVYVAKQAVFVCPLPFVVIRWRRYGVTRLAAGCCKCGAWHRPDLPGPVGDTSASGHRAGGPVR